MSDQPRDWDKELAAIDKVIASQPAGRAEAPAPAGATRAGSPAPASDRPIGRMAALTTWLRVLLGVLLAAAITQWPYPSACGVNLAVYLGAIGAVVVAGAWSGATSWTRRQGWAHLFSLLVLLWGLVLGAREILPRIGYAAHHAAWTCD
jgi:hypothetical protein